MQPGHEHFFELAGIEAQKALCLKDKCGAVVVLKGEVIGSGHNGPPLDDISHRKCHLNLIHSLKPKSDRTCCIHAEHRAIRNALSLGKSLQGATLYFTRIDNDGKLLKSGVPYCTMCSREALDSGISFFALWHEGGIHVYPTLEYNELSYAFHQQPVP